MQYMYLKEGLWGLWDAHARMMKCPRSTSELLEYGTCQVKIPIRNLLLSFLFKTRDGNVSTAERFGLTRTGTPIESSSDLKSGSAAIQCVYTGPKMTGLAKPQAR